MKTQLRALITDLIEGGLSALRAAGTLPADLVSPDFVIERPKERAHGDFSTNAAMLLARELGKRGAKTNPRALAQQLVNALPASDAIAKVELAGPGFINIHLTPAAWQQQVRDIHVAAESFGRNANGNGKTVGVSWTLMKPGPAISTFSMCWDFGRLVAMACASSRGFLRSGLASSIATLVA